MAAPSAMQRIAFQRGATRLRAGDHTSHGHPPRHHRSNWPVSCERRARLEDNMKGPAGRRAVKLSISIAGSEAEFPKQISSLNPQAPITSAVQDPFTIYIQFKLTHLTHVTNPFSDPSGRTTTALRALPHFGICTSHSGSTP